MRGRKPLPAALKVVRGNPGKRKIEPDPAPPMKKPPAPPSFLPRLAKTEFRRLAKQLVKIQVMSELDRNQLAQYCTAWAIWRDAVGAYNEHGPLLILRDEEGNVESVVKNPAVATINKQVDVMIRIASSFGFDPASRARLKPASGNEAPADPFTQFGKAK